MPGDAGKPFSDAERAELDRAVEALAESPRLSHLLRYMGARLFAGEIDQLNEYNIATEVFGRSKTTFNTAEDAIARVETHRLRKSLAAFYETEGRDHPIQVSLPSRSYVPVLIHKPAGAPSPASAVVAQTPGLTSPGPGDRFARWTVGRWRYLAAAAGVISVSLGAYLYFRAGASSNHAKTDARPAGTSASAPVQPAVPPLPIRLLAGYHGPPRIDGAGNTWNPDGYFTGGGQWRRSPGFIARASDPFIFENFRNADFSYNIPLKPGSYELHLFFSAPFRANENFSTFNVSVNGRAVLQGFDIEADALGQDVADERIFRDVGPGEDGFLRIGFAGELGLPTLNAMEVLPGLAGAQLPIRLVMQSTPFSDQKGQYWRPDNYFMGGRLSGRTHPVINSADPDLFSRERFGNFNYALPVDTRGRYTLILHFVEFYFDSETLGNGGKGGRVFKVICNGETLLDNFDILQETRTFHEVSKTFRHLKPSAQGKLNLTFEPIVNNATISGIEVLDESH